MMRSWQFRGGRSGEVDGCHSLPGARQQIAEELPLSGLIGRGSGSGSGGEPAGGLTLGGSVALGYPRERGNQKGEGIHQADFFGRRLRDSSNESRNWGSVPSAKDVARWRFLPGDFRRRREYRVRNPRVQAPFFPKLGFTPSSHSPRSLNSWSGLSAGIRTSFPARLLSAARTAAPSCE